LSRSAERSCRPALDQPFDIGFHQDLQDRLRNGLQEIAVAALLQQIGQCHSVIGHWVLKEGSRVKYRNATGAAPPDDHLCFTRAPRSMWWGIPPGARAWLLISTASWHHPLFSPRSSPGISRLGGVKETKGST
jgi:hypothetical protein